MDAGKDDGSFVQIENALRSAAWIGQVPWLYWLHDYFIPLFGNRLGIGARHGSLRSFASREIQDRKTRGSDHQDILAKLFAVQKERPTEMNDNGVISMATSNIFAGSDTTAISIRSIVFHLCENPQYKRTLVEEIDSQQRARKLSIPAKLEEAKNMPYLQACLYEGLRCHPAVGMSLPRMTPKGGIAVDGKYIPKGVSKGLWRPYQDQHLHDQTVIGVNPWVIHQNKEVSGADADVFRPDRWLQVESTDMGRSPVFYSVDIRLHTDSNALAERYFFAFGSGARTCLGRSMLHPSGDTLYMLIGA